jgi:uncharacterized protein
VRNVVVFMLVGSLVWGGLHVYVWKRLLMGVVGWKRRVGLGVGIVGGLLGPGSMALGRALGATAWPWMMWGAYLYMGFFLLLLTLSVVRDAVLGVMKAVRKVQGRGVQDEGRRGVLMGVMNWGVVGLTGAMVGVGYAEAKTLAKVVEVDVQVKGLEKGLDGLRIVQISDVHVGPTIRGEYLRAVVERVNEQRPDIVAITGDLVDGYVEELGAEIAWIKDIKATMGVYFVTGNHEYYWDGPAWERFISGLGVTVLSNAHAVLERGGARLVVAGVTDFSAGRIDEAQRSDPKRAVQGAPEGVFRLMLAHQPKSVHDVDAAGADLMLSGHTHGGQFFPVNMFVGLAHPFSAGLHPVGDKMQIYVSRGTGYWGPPLRLGAPSEITALTLRAVG